MQAISTFYSIYFRLAGAKKLPVAVQLTSGPNTISPLDLAPIDGSFQSYFGTGSMRPSLSDTYAFSVTYSDATSETVNLIVSEVLDALARTLSPTGTVSGGSLTPTFTWSAPTSPPSSYTYFFYMYANGGGNIWQYPGQHNNGQGMPSSTTSLVYNLDGHASQASLTQGTQYHWSITVQDSLGNQAQQNVMYTPTP